MMSSRDEGRPRKTGRGPSGRWGAQTVQARTSARSRSKASLLIQLVPALCVRFIEMNTTVQAERVIKKRGRIDSGPVAVYKACGIRRVDPTHRWRGGRVAE